MNNPITLISPVQSLVDRFCYRCMRSSANFGTVWFPWFTRKFSKADKPAR